MADPPGDIPVQIRSFRPEDIEAVRKLYREGLLGGQLAENDTGLDIDDIDAAYMRPPGNHFWVAQTSDGQIVGMIGVQHHDKDVGEIRRLRIHEGLRGRGIGAKLVETALKFCADHQYLKVTLDTFMDREPAIRLFEKYRFRHEKTKSVSGKELLYFYLDIYGREDQQPQPPQVTKKA